MHRINFILNCGLKTESARFPNRIKLKATRYALLFLLLGPEDVECSAGQKGTGTSVEATSGVELPAKNGRETTKFHDFLIVVFLLFTSKAVQPKRIPSSRQSCRLK